MVKRGSPFAKRMRRKPSAHVPGLRRRMDSAVPYIPLISRRPVLQHPVGRVRVGTDCAGLEVAMTVFLKPEPGN